MDSAINIEIKNHDSELESEAETLKNSEDLNEEGRTFQKHSQENVDNAEVNSLVKSIPSSKDNLHPGYRKDSTRSSIEITEVTIINSDIDCNSDTDRSTIEIKQHKKSCHKTKNAKKKDNQRRGVPKRTLYIALVAFILNPPIGALALVLYCISKEWHKKELRPESRRMGKVAKWLSVVSIAITCVAIPFVLVYQLIIKPNIVSDIRELF